MPDLEEPCLDDSIPHVFLMAASLYCSPEPTVVTTLLGSCVAVCLWDRRLQVGGINHFVLPRDLGGRDPRYGDAAIDQLVAKMEALGCDRYTIEAKIFGGAYVLSLGTPERQVGAKNVDMAVSRLRHYDIPITARRTGGDHGVLIRFCTHTGGVLARPILP